MVSKLESPLPIVREPGPRAVARREAPESSAPEPAGSDPDLRLTLSAAARRLALPPVESEAPGGQTEGPGNGTVAAYREEPRPVLGARVSIRV